MRLEATGHGRGLRRALGLTASRGARSLTLARDSARILPLDPRRIHSLAVVAFSAPMDVRAGAALAAELRRIYDTISGTLGYRELRQFGAQFTEVEPSRMVRHTLPSSSERVTITPSG